MPKIEIRPAVSDDLEALMALDHSVETNYVWQMESRYEDDQYNIQFCQVKLPHEVRIPYPRPPEVLREDWKKRSLILVGAIGNKAISYIDLFIQPAAPIVWVLDLVVQDSSRRQGIGTALLLAAQEWARQRKLRSMMLEIQPKNHPAICLARKLRFEFSGYNDHYYSNQDIALFFARYL
ncbi:MAG: GNAT family N-acetyltransferase [Anaerolineaceae bacterium]|jgi:ribosomal protein S18 acetylase RimI-like enzyme